MTLKAISTFPKGRRRAHGSIPTCSSRQKKIKEENMWESKDWTVKVDADAVFLPMRLRKKLSEVEVSDKGVYLENCKYVKFGFFGNLEVISKTGFGILLENLDNCKSSL